MEFFLRFAYASLLYILIPLVLFIAILKLKYVKKIIYRYSLASVISDNGLASRHPYKKIFFLLRFITLLGLALLIGKPQLVDPRSNVKVEGIDIVIALDASGSMKEPFSKSDKKTRFDVAKKEAIRFIKKRENDPIGLVIFGRDSISRCPITLDKTILHAMVKDLKLGLVDPDGTFLATSILTAANRLKDSKAKTKIIILLTDGAPSPDDIRPQEAIDIAKKLDIKVYTVGIGSDEMEYQIDPLYGYRFVPGVNRRLLTKIAKETGGKFFMAKNPQEMRNIYETINRLETTEYETDIYSRYFDIFMPFLWALFGMILLELLFSTFIWFAL